MKRLRAEMQERDDVLAMAAHELRNPLHALTMQLALARNTAESHQQADTLARIVKAQVTLARYVDRVTVLLDLVRARSEAYPLSIRSFDLVATLREVVEELTPDARFRGVEIRSELPETCLVTTDALIVEQLVDNLLLNALKHAACSVVTVRLGCSEGFADIEVADNGRGIAEQDQERIFGKFGVAQEGNRGPGSGLGLWIVRTLLAELNGSISVKSQPGSGAVFKLRIPMFFPSDSQP